MILLFMVSAVSANDLNKTELDNTDNNNLHLSNSIYIDADNGDDANDGKSSDNSVKTLAKALEISNDNDTIILSDGIYKGSQNTKVTITKSVNIQGGSNTTFDGEFSSYLFIIPDSVSVTIKNIKFINAYKSVSDTELIDGYDNEGIYGAALDIKNAKVTLDNCYFKYNMVNYNNFVEEFVYGGAISNLGDLTVLNTDFYGNAVGTDENILAYGGSIYNRGRLVINNSNFIESSGYSNCLGGAIYNDGNAIMDKSSISKSHLYENTKGSAIYNAGTFTLLNSVIESNIIERSDDYYIYGAIFNNGDLISESTVFRNNTAYYKAPFTQYIGSPTIYNIGNLDLSYNVFADNGEFNGISTDIYLTGGGNIRIDDNWWQTNDNPFFNDKINMNILNSWITSQLSPQYSSLNLNDNINISHCWMSSSGNLIPASSVPARTVMVWTNVNGAILSKTFKTNESNSFNFNNTLFKGSYVVNCIVDSVESQMIVDVGKINTYIEVIVNNDTFYYGNEIILNLTLKDRDDNPISGKINLRINGENRVVDVDEGKASIMFSNLSPQNYTVSLSYYGDSTYARSFNQSSFTVNKMEPQLIIGDVGNIETSDSVNLNVTLKYASSSIAEIYINGQFKQEVYLNNGGNTINFNYFEEGEYNITIIYPENDFYKSSRESVLFNVSKVQASLKVSTQNITAGDDEIITIEVFPDNFNSEIILSINGINQTVLLKNKVNTIRISQLTNGTYDVKVFFNGNNRFYRTNASSFFTVKRGTSSLNVTVEKNNLTGKVTVQTNQTKCSGIIDLFINNKHYAASLIRGQATFNVEFYSGSNYIYVFYGGDDFYDGSTWNTSIGEPLNPFLIAENVKSYEFNNFTYSVILCEENGFAIPNKNILIKFLDKTYNVTTNNYGIAELTFNLKEGNYTIESSYENLTITNMITVEKIEFDLTVHNITFFENELIKVNFENNITGFIHFKLSDNQTAVIEIKNRTALWNLSNLNSGKWEVEVFYTNILFNSSALKKSFNVQKTNFTYNIDYFGLNLGDETYINLTLPSQMTGNIIFIVDGVEFNKTIESDNVILKLNNLSPGYHNLTVVYSGDNNFNNYSFNTKFSIRSFKTNLNLFINSTEYGQELKIAARLNENATGYVEFTVNSVKSLIKIDDGVAVWNLGGLDVGEYTVHANYLGDDLFIDTLNETNFTVKKANSHINLYVKEVYLDQNIRIYANLSSNATGIVSFSMKDYYSPRNRTITNSSCSWYISPLEYGQYIVFASYYGDKNYYPSNETFILNVTQYRSILDVTIKDVTENERVTATVHLSNDKGVGITDSVVLTIDSKSYNVNLRRGVGTLVLGKYPIGNYTFSAVYEGNSKYAKSSVNGFFKVTDSVSSVNLEVDNFTKYIGSDKKFNIRLTQTSGQGISGAVIQIIINNNLYEILTDDDGIALFDVNLPVGKYNAVIRFNQTDKYYGAESQADIEVLSTIRAIDLIKLYGMGGQYFAIFTDSDGKALSNTPVTFTISGNQYSFITAPNGIVRIDINLKPGTYTIIANNPVTGEKAQNIIYIYQYIMENNDVVKYYGGKEVYRIKVLDDFGNPVSKGQLVKFTINGKVYNVKTDDEGYAFIYLNLKPKSYTVSASYHNFNVYNKIIVKPVLTISKFTVKGKIIKFKVKLVNSKGKPWKGKKITFIFKSKKYNVKTNKKGFASVKIKKKLKIGRHKITAKYGKSLVRHTFIIKSK